MKVCVLGMWHLGSVTAACVASLSHHVVGYDESLKTVDALRRCEPPVGEPGLSQLIQEQRQLGRLEFTNDLSSAVNGAAIIWVTYDTPVDVNDNADVDHVLSRVSATYPYVEADTLVLVSSQLPVGSVAKLKQRYGQESSNRVFFASSPENLRLGKAIDAFLSPDRIVIGLHENDVATISPRLQELFGPLSAKILLMGVESAEMTKNAINAFLATSVTFINEIAALCEAVGADAAEVERGLKTESRIGAKAYLGPGAAFAGGTLARDVQFLRATGLKCRKETPLFDGVFRSNEQHRKWPCERLRDVLGNLRDRRIAVWGLTYKPGTTTLRRSDAINLCRQLIEEGARVTAHDPVIHGPCPELGPEVALFEDPIDAAREADAVVVSTTWPQFRDLSLDALYSVLRRPVLIDATRFLGSLVSTDDRFEYYSVGRRG